VSRIVVVLPTVSLIPAVISVRWLMGEKNAAIEPDMASGAMLTGCDAERNALALMDNPSIAKLR
jgi:hypothetical protein